MPDTRIYIDPYTGKLLQVGGDSTDPLGKQIMRSTSTLNFGRWGSMGSKILYFVLGLLPLRLYLTGILMFIRRRKAKVASLKRKRQKSEAVLTV